MDIDDLIAEIKKIETVSDIDRLSVPIWERRNWLLGEAVEAKRLEAIMDASATWEEGQRVVVRSAYRTLEGKSGTIKKVLYPERGNVDVRLAVRLDTGPRKSPAYYVDSDGNILLATRKESYVPWAEAI